MSDLYQPTYFLDFLKRHPASRQQIMELNREMWREEEERNHRIVRNIGLSWGTIYLATIVNGPLPFLRKNGLVFNTNRVFRQYLYTGVLAYYLAIRPFNYKLGKIEKKLNDIMEYREQNEEAYIEPSRPLAYSNKRY